MATRNNSQHSSSEKGPTNYIQLSWQGPSTVRYRVLSSVPIPEQQYHGPSDSTITATLPTKSTQTPIAVEKIQGQPTCSLIVGTTIETAINFNVPIGLLTKYSRYFRKALRNCGPQKYLRVNGCNGEHFKCFVDWLYSSGKDQWPLGPSGFNLLSTFHMLELWILGDFLEAPKFQNRIMLLLLKGEHVHTEDINDSQVEYIFNRTSLYSPLCWIMVLRCDRTVGEVRAKCEPKVNGDPASPSSLPTRVALDVYHVYRAIHQEFEENGHDILVDKKFYVNEDMEGLVKPRARMNLAERLRSVDQSETPLQQSSSDYSHS